MRYCTHCGAPLTPHGICQDDCDGFRASELEQGPTYHDAKERYERDPHFRTLVDLMTQFIVKHKYTPGEMRDAAFMAALNFEMMHTRGGIVRIPA